MPATSLADWLRTQPDETLAALLRVRRDLATPPPADTAVLATRAGSPGSVARVCEELDTRALAVLEALLLVEADTEPVPHATVTAWLGTDPGATIDHLRGKALVWGPDEEISVIPAAREVLGPFPAGLGASAPTLEDTDILATLAELGEDERGLLNTLAQGQPIGQTKDASADVPLARANTPVQRLLARGLLLRRDTQTVELPRQVGLALRDGRAFDERALHHPELPTNRHTPSTVDETAAGEALEFLRQMETLLGMWSQQPPSTLKAGGLGVRELRRVARDLEITETQATLLIELAVGAGLVAASPASTPEWVPTTLTDSWLASGPATRWASIATAWLELPRQPGLVGQRDGKDKTIAPLAEEARRPLAPAIRGRVLHTLAELAEGDGVKGVEELVTVLAWRAPRKGGRTRDEGVRWALSEAAALGVVALGALTTASRALLDEDRSRATAAMAQALPQPVDHVLVQADLTVVAPGPLEPELAAEITAVSDVESAGHATVYRVTESSIRSALDTGRTADELHDLFANRSRTPVPQSLSYLIDDVARRHGRLRGRAAGSFLRCDDEVLLAEVLGNSAAERFDLRKIAPTVLVSPFGLTEVLEGLRAAGFAPAAEGPDGRVVDLRSTGRRIEGTRGPRRVASEPTAIDPEQASAVVAHLRAGDKAADTRRGDTVRLSPGGGADTSATLALLSQATRERREVWIGFVDSHGTASQRIVRPANIGGGVLEGAEGKRYPLHRITSAALIED